jgi:hypothetical protein
MKWSLPDCKANFLAFRSRSCKSKKNCFNKETSVRKAWLVAGMLTLAVLAAVVWLRPRDVGRPRAFRDQAYYFESLRVQNDIAGVGGDTNEAMQAVAGIKAGDAEGWYNSWKAAGDRVSEMAARTNDPISKGNAYLRAHTYYRSAEFFLNPKDPRRSGLWARNIDSFEAGLKALRVAHERFVVPYGPHHLNAIYYPGPAGSEHRPLLMVVGGYDSTMEELYFSAVAAALQRGYSVLTYEGPGQGSVLREQRLPMQPDWEKPNGAVLVHRAARQTGSDRAAWRKPGRISCPAGSGVRQKNRRRGGLRCLLRWLQDCYRQGAVMDAFPA